MLQVIGRGHILRFTLSPASQGKYLCEASASGFTKIRTTFHVKIRGPPEIFTEDPVKTGTIGESVTMWCQVRRHGGPMSVVWKHGGHVIRPDNPYFSILDTIDKDLLKSVVLIRNLKEQHFGKFTCEIENKFGKNSAEIELSEKAPFPQLVIVCSTLSVCLLIIVMIVIIITCRHSSTSSTSAHHHITNDEYLQIQPKAMLQLQPAPDILYSHPHHLGHNIRGTGETGVHNHGSNNTNHPTEDNKLVWTVPICTSSVKSDIYSDHENYSYLSQLRGPSFDNYARIDTQTDNYFDVGSNPVDLDESSPGTHV